MCIVAVVPLLVDFYVCHVVSTLHVALMIHSCIQVVHYLWLRLWLFLIRILHPRYFAPVPISTNELEQLLSNGMEPKLPLTNEREGYPYSNLVLEKRRIHQSSYSALHQIVSDASTTLLEVWQKYVAFWWEFSFYKQGSTPHHQVFQVKQNAVDTFQRLVFCAKHRFQIEVSPLLLIVLEKCS